MQRWSGRVAMVTGASSGIGAAIVRELVQHGMLTVGFARRVDRVQALSEELKGCPGMLHPVQGDITKESDILAAFKWAKEQLGGVDVLINNAGIFEESPLTAAPTEEWRRQLDVNVVGLSICTREAVKGMRERGVDDGHVIHISSVAGHNMPHVSNLAMYSATKHAVRVLAEGLRKDLQAGGSKIRISCVSPGLVRTELVADSDTLSLDKNPSLQAKDIAGAVLYALGQPPHVQVHEVIIKPIGELV